jgi:hypothetical protein
MHSVVRLFEAVLPGGIGEQRREARQQGGHFLRIEHGGLNHKSRAARSRGSRIFFQHRFDIRTGSAAGQYQRIRPHASRSLPEIADLCSAAVLLTLP